MSLHSQLFIIEGVENDLDSASECSVSADSGGE